MGHARSPQRQRRSFHQRFLAHLKYGNRRTAPVRRSKLTPILAGVVFALTLEGLAIGEAGRAAVVSALRDPTAMFAQRSPGSRGDGALQSTKGARRNVAPVVARPAPSGATPVDQVPAAYFAMPDLPVDNLLPTPSVNDFAALAGSPFGGIPYFGGLPIFGGGAPGSGPGLPGVVPQNPPPPAAVPEPTTWLMFLVGMFGSGALLRRAHRAGRVYNP